MNKRFFFYTVFFFLLVSCTEQTETIKSEVPMNNFAVIQGSIVQHDSTIVFKVGNFFDGKDTVKVNKDGSFFHVFDINDARFQSFTYGNSEFDLFFSPGDTLSVEFDGESLSNWKFSGKHANENETKEEQYKIFENAAIVQLEMDSIYRLPSADFIELIAELNDLFEAFILPLEEDGQLNSAFLELLRISHQISKGLELFQYPMYYNYFNDTTVEMKNDYYHFLNEIPFDLPQFVGNTDYSQFSQLLLQHHVNLKTKADSTLKQDPTMEFTTKLDVIEELFNHRSVVDFVTYEMLNSHLKNSAKGITDELLHKALSMLLDEEKKSELTDQYNKWTALSTGSRAPEIVAEYVDETSFSTRDLLGKYIYVDVWATWCGPCIAEIPKLEELQKHFADANIAFVSVSIDMEYDAWKAKVENDNLQGIQVAARSDENIDQLLEDYQISGIPRFILIDPEGKIIDVNAPRPSGDIFEVLTELLK